MVGDTSYGDYNVAMTTIIISPIITIIIVAMYKTMAN